MFKFIVHVPNHIKKFLFYFLIDFVQFDYRIFITGGFLRNMKNIPEKARKTLTLDNGKEFVKHVIYRLILALKLIFVTHTGQGKRL